MSPRAHRSRSLRLLGACAVAATLAVVGSPAAAQAQECPAAPPTGQTSMSFGYTGGLQQFAVPAYVDQVSVTVRGANGGSTPGKTGTGGRPGLVTGRLSVTGGSCLGITVGGYAGGSGYGQGGSQGGFSGGYGVQGGLGGGGSAIAPLNGTPVVVAGGGGGAGGDSGYEFTNNGDFGGTGGDGAGGNGPGTPQGGPGGDPPRHHVSKGLGGVRNPSNGPNGQNGTLTSMAGDYTGCGASSGGGGGGGGGLHGGGAGGEMYTLIPGSNYVCENQTIQYAGGGGAGGDSFADPTTFPDPSFTVDSGDCTAAGATCDGTVGLDWSIDVGSVTAASGAKQSTYIDARYPTLLQARVIATNGAPIPDFPVSFSLPTTGPTATFATGPTPASSVTVLTDDSGTATAPPMTAGDAVGAFTATAVVAGTSLTARYALANTPVPTATSLSTLPGNPSVTLEPVRFVADVGQAPSTAPSPVGTVVFRRGGVELSSAPVDANGVAISEPVALGTGDQVVTAQFVPSDRFLGSQASLTQHVLKAGTAVDIGSSANPSQAGGPVTFDATVVPLAPGAGTPTGSVTFTVDGAPLSGETALVDGHATSAVVHLSDGPHDVLVQYRGDDGYAASTGSARQSVGAGATATTLTAEPRSPVVGQASLVTVKVAPPAESSTAVPSGGVDVLVDGIVVCDDVSLVAGAASCSVTSPLLPGPHDITAQYLPGSGAFLASSGRLTQLVSKGRTQMTIEATPDPSVFGQQVRLHAQAAAAGAASGTPSGTVAFSVDGEPVGNPVPLRDGQADSIPIPRLDAGPHVIRAQSSGDASFVANAIADTQSVDPGETVGGLTSSAPNAAPGTEVRFTMQVGIVAPALGQPGGTVRFTVDGRSLGAPVAVLAGAAVSAPVSTLAAGAHMVHASYLGDAGFSRVDGLLTQRIVAPAGPDAPVTPVPGTPGAPIAPPVIPAKDRSPLLCSRTLDITAISLSNGRVRIVGVAAAPLVGTEVALRSGGAVLARTVVKADGSFAADVPRPYGVQQRDLAFVATAGSDRSASAKVQQALRIVHVRDLGRGRVRVEALLTGAGSRKLTAQVRRRIACGPPRTVTKPKVRAATRRGGARRIVATVNRPAASLGTAAVTVVVGRQASLPVLVTP